MTPMRKKTMKLLGHETAVTVVDIVERKERGPAEYTLEDGSIIRFSAVPTEVMRVDGQFNNDGNPIYIVTNGVVVNVVHAPDDLKRKG